MFLMQSFKMCAIFILQRLIGVQELIDNIFKMLQSCAFHDNVIFGQLDGVSWQQMFTPDINDVAPNPKGQRLKESQMRTKG